MNQPVISIIIPTLGDQEKLERLLTSIQKQKFLGASDIFEVIVVVNGAKVQLAAADFQKLSTLFGPVLKFQFLNQKGVNVARNAGLRQAQAGIVLFLDDDCELHEPYFLSRHISFHNEHPAVFATGGGYQTPLGTGRFDEVYNLIQMHWFTSGLNFPGQNESTRYLLGGNFSIKARIAETLKLIFDEKIVYGGSESEFFKKAGLLKLELRVNSFDVLHHTCENLLSLTRKLYKQGRGKALVDEKYPETASAVEIRRAGTTDNWLRLVFNYAFWCGYYFYRKEYFRIFPHVIKDGIAALNVARFRLLNGILKRIAEKKEKGDRF